MTASCFRSSDQLEDCMVHLVIDPIGHILGLFAMVQACSEMSPNIKISLLKFEDN